MSKSPADIDTSDRLLSTFGCIEYEQAICAIIDFLRSDASGADIPAWLGDRGSGWDKKFRIDTIAQIEPALFAMLCADGWIAADHFPKYTFRLSAEARRRLESHVPYAKRKRQ